MKRLMAFLLLLILSPLVSSADDCCDCRCNHCGCHAQCQKVCHIVCEMKDVKVTCYCCREEDICIPGHSKKCGEVCEPNPCCLAHPELCDGCANGNCCSPGCASCKYETRTVWQPSCSGDIRTVNKLIKYEVTKKVPTYKWVVEYCCNPCCCELTEEARRDGKQIAVGTPPKSTSANVALKNPPAKAPAPPPKSYDGGPSKFRPTDEPERLQPMELKSDNQKSGVVRTSHQSAALPLPLKLLFQ
jgi:hypothetical protein